METSIKSLQKRNRCYSEKGKRCVIKTQSQEVFKKYTGIFAISVNVVGWDLYEKSGINADRMVDFLEANITNKFKNKLIILDNASSHRNPKVKEVINIYRFSPKRCNKLSPKKLGFNPYNPGYKGVFQKPTQSCFTCNGSNTPSSSFLPEYNNI